MITWDDFEKIELRIGTIIEVADFPEARKPAYKLRVDFGQDIGIRKSSAQLTDRYDKEDRSFSVRVPGHWSANLRGRSYPGKAG